MKRLYTFWISVLFNLFFISSVTAQYLSPLESTTDRFLRYVKIDTQSKYDVDTVPSTQKQFDLARLLVKEINFLGATGITLSDHCIVYATIPANLEDNTNVPVLGLIAHLDTSPDVSGTNVNPIIHSNYQGGEITLPEDTSQKITSENSPEIKKLIGDDIITADGTTLLGADDKAGCAEIMTTLDILQQNPQIKHGDIAIAFIPDEEVGRGIDKFDIELFGADYAITVDGISVGEINIETFFAREATITFKGKAYNPGYAENKMINSTYAAADFITRLPKDMLPETTSGREGFLHPYNASLAVESSKIEILLRDFELEGLDKFQLMLVNIAKEVEENFPEVNIDIIFRDEYMNMKEVLKDHPLLTECIFEASEKAGIEPYLVAVRGGTDGAILTFKGIPCPNLFSGGENYHSKLEFISRNRMDKTTETLVNLVQIFAEKYNK